MKQPLILIIDDKVQIEKSLTSTWASYEWSTKELATAAVGLPPANVHHCNLILRDIGLSDIVISIQSNQEDVDALDYSAYDHVIKHFKRIHVIKRNSFYPPRSARYYQRNCYLPRNR